MLEKSKVHTIMSNGLTPGMLCDVNGKWEIATSRRKHLFNSKCIPFYLYFTSDEEIKEGEWMLNLIGNPDEIRGWELVQAEYNYAGKDNPWQRKIVATTNPELWKVSKFSHHSQDLVKIAVYKDYPTGIHKISTDFPEAFVREQGIWEVNLEKEEYDNPNFNRNKGVSIHNPTYLTKYKLNSQGAVIVHKVKERVYTRAQMIRFAQHIHANAYLKHNIPDLLDIFKF